MSRSRYLEVNTPDGTDVARVSIACKASTRRRFCSWKTLRTIDNACGEVTRNPLTVCFSIPAAESSSSSCGPAPCNTIGVRPTCCRKVSDEVSAGRASRNTAPPTLTTAKRFASSCEKRFRYCWVSFALPMLESRRTMVLRVLASLVMVEAAPVFKASLNFSSREGSYPTVSRLPTVDHPVYGLRVMLQWVEGHPLVGRMRLGNVAGAINERGIAGCREQGRFGPEIHRVADRDTELVGQVACGQAACFGGCGVTGRQ